MITTALPPDTRPALPNAAAAQTQGGHMAPITHAAIVNDMIAGFLAGAEVDA